LAVVAAPTASAAAAAVPSNSTAALDVTPSERLHERIQAHKRLNVARFCQTGIGGWDAIQN